MHWVFFFLFVACYSWYQLRARCFLRYGKYINMNVRNIRDCSKFVLFLFSSLKTSTMKRFEPTLYEEMVERNKGKVPEKIYFNKGL